ncbi:hypothetical protein RND71_043889 [Anisodus tanguticus]|uniref:Kinesin-like protein n=1 Tax=Anisodus tanguticus TaxID=243964 RepID=A0AAE1QP19_9SOLA|nr:hypothetical protein RND71_043889 [Anisodus tanguticus]
MKTKNKKDNSKDPVKVYCRLRPPKSLTELLSVKRYSDNVIQLYHPLGLKPEAYYNFKYVFPQEATQKEVFDEIAYPLVEDLLNGKDGLLFTYGITSSGKTFTLTGKCQSPGILPRTLDVIFNTIKDRQARKFVFKPDGQNYFEIRSTADAIIDWQKEKQAQQKLLNFASRTPSRKKNNNNDDYKDWDTRVKDDSVVELPEDNKNAFSVFISYVEIYNNYIYDLLDDTVIDQIKLKQPQSKLLREDIRKKVFVLNGVEHEVKSSDEATELFIKGIKRRKIAHTTLNAESSRSHSVFNIKIVQAPKDAEEEVVLDSKYMTVSQLSLVDLAGSERANRTKNAGDRLKEASNDGDIETQIYKGDVIPTSVGGAQIMSLAPQFEEAASTIKNEFDSKQVVFAKIDCEKEALHDPDSFKETQIGLRSNDSHQLIDEEEEEDNVLPNFNVDETTLDSQALHLTFDPQTQQMLNGEQVVVFEVVQVNNNENSGVTAEEQQYATIDSDQVSINSQKLKSTTATSSKSNLKTVNIEENYIIQLQTEDETAATQIEENSTIVDETNIKNKQFDKSNQNDISNCFGFKDEDDDDHTI